MKKYKFDCGCEIDIIDEKIKDYDGLPTLKIDYDNIPMNCPKVWELISEGNTKGVFQLESGLGISWAKRVKPCSIEELADLISIIRPGTLDAVEDGKSMTKHYVDRKNGEEDWKNVDPSLDIVLNKTYGIIVYQEQAMAIAKIVAGFDLKQADNLRKAIGKKIASLMTSIRNEFLDGCKKVGILDDDIAGYVFDIIEKSSRYSFNASHAVSYAVTAYQTAWSKAHLPEHFFCSWLTFANDSLKPKEEIAELVRNAKFSSGVQVELPDVRSCTITDDFYINDDKIFFGLSKIRNVGKKKLAKFINVIKSELNITTDPEKFDFSMLEYDIDWKTLLFKVLYKCEESVVSSLIKGGAFSYLSIGRKRMFNDLELIKNLTKREVDYLIENFDKFSDVKVAIKFLGISGICKGKRVTKIVELAKSFDYEMSESLYRDTIESVVKDEKDLLGIAISANKVMNKRPEYVTDTCDTLTPSKANIIVAAEIVSCRPYQQKNGKNAGKEMCYLTCVDDLGMIQVLAFAQKYEEIKGLCFEGNTVVISGRTDDNCTLIVERMIQI